MQIRNRLTLQFMFIVTLMFLVGFGIVYYSSAVYRKKELYRRLENKGRTSMEVFESFGRKDVAMMREIERTQKDKVTFEKLAIYDSEGRLLYANTDSLPFIVTPALLDEVRRAGYLEFSEGKFEVLGQTFEHGHVCFSAGVDIYGRRKVENLRNTLLILLAVIVTISAITGRVFAGRALRPLNDIIEDVKRINVEQLNRRLERHINRDEIGRLVETFNVLLDKLEKSVQLQKLFVSGASHELKNPLTSITSQLQVALLNRRTNEEYETLIRSVLSDMQSLNQTTISLMEYARLSYENYVQRSEVRIDDILWSCVDFFRKTNEEYKVNIIFANMPDDERRLLVYANAGFIRTAFINLIDNACKFSGDKTCNVTLTVGDRQLKVDFSDSGIGLDEQEIALIFEPFYRSNSTAEKKGHGIGLALTRKIFDLHSANVQVRSKRGVGTTFTVQLPATA